MQNHRQFLFVIGRTVLRQRATFVRRLRHYLTQWERSPGLEATEPRARFSYGVGYAAFMAINEAVQIYDARQCEEFCQHMARKTTEGTQEVAARVDVYQFFADLLSALNAGVFGTTAAELQRFFKIVPNKNGSPRLTERQLRDSADNPCLVWKSYFLFIRPGPVIDALREYKRRQGLQLPLDQQDLLTQLKVKPSFLPAPRQGHMKKFGKGSKTNQYCWGLDLDKLEGLGFRPVSDEDWESSLYPEGDKTANKLPLQEWIDPRKGDLFDLVDKLLKED
jgi:hypothetical protein